MQIRLALKESQDFERAVLLVKSTYMSSFGAKIEPRPDCFAVCESNHLAGTTQVLAVAGFSYAEQRSALFSEQYLDERVEAVLSRLERRHVERDAIVEVGSLAAVRSDAGLELTRLLPILAWCQGREFVLCTVTEQMKRILQKIGLTFHTLRTADPARLGPSAGAEWGKYYEKAPVTGYVNLGAIPTLFASNTGRYSFANLQIDFREAVALEGRRAFG
jgi:hypothetical protein